MRPSERCVSHSREGPRIGECAPSRVLLLNPIHLDTRNSDRTGRPQGLLLRSRPEEFEALDFIADAVEWPEGDLRDEDQQQRKQPDGQGD